jgi:tetratricopeptide (TPR) repeat protein
MIAGEEPDQRPTNQPRPSDVRSADTKLIRDALSRGMIEGAKSIPPGAPDVILNGKAIRAAIRYLQSTRLLVISGAEGSGASTVALCAVRELTKESSQKNLLYLDCSTFSVNLDELLRKVRLATSLRSNPANSSIQPEAERDARIRGTVILLDNVDNATSVAHLLLKELQDGYSFIIATSNGFSDLPAVDAKLDQVRIPSFDAAKQQKLISDWLAGAAVNAPVTLGLNSAKLSLVSIRVLVGLTDLKMLRHDLAFKSHNSSLPEATWLSELIWSCLDSQTRTVLHSVLDAGWSQWAIQDVVSVSGLDVAVAESSLEKLVAIGVFDKIGDSHVLQNSLRRWLAGGAKQLPGSSGNLQRALASATMRTEAIAMTLRGIGGAEDHSTERVPPDVLLSRSEEDHVIAAHACWLEREWISLRVLLERAAAAAQWQALDEIIGSLEACLPGLNREADRDWITEIGHCVNAQYGGTRRRFWHADETAKSLEAEGRLIEAMQQRYLALDLASAGGRRDDVGESLMRLARLKYSMGNATEAILLAERAAAELREGGYAAQEGCALVELSELYRVSGKPEDAFHAVRRAIQLLPQESSRVRGAAFDRLGILYEDYGQLDSAKAAYRESAIILMELGDPRTLWSIESLARVASQTGDIDEAVELLRAILDTYHQNEDAEGEMRALVIYADLLQNAGMANEAFELWKRAHDLVRKDADPEYYAYTLVKVTDYRVEFEGPSDMQLTKSAYDESFQVWMQRGEHRRAASVLLSLSQASAVAGELISARDAAMSALRIYEQSQSSSGVAHASFYLGRINCRLGDFAASSLCYERGAAIFRSQRNVRDESVCLVELAEVYGLMGREEDAEELKGRLRARDDGS